MPRFLGVFSGLTLVSAFLIAAAMSGCGIEQTAIPSDDSPVGAVRSSAESDVADADGPLDLARPTDAEKLAHLLYFVQALDRLKKGGTRETLGVNVAQAREILTLSEALDELNAEAQAAPQEKSDEFGPRYDAMVERVNRELRTILTAEQFNALRVEVLDAQIGATAFLMPGVPATLELTDRQLARISALIEAHKEELQPRNFTVWNLRKVIALGRELRAKAELLLTDDQKDRWTEIVTGRTPVVE